MHGTHNVKWMLNTLQWEKVQLDKWFELVLGSFLVILHLRYTKIRTLQHVVSWRVFFWRSHGKLLIFTEGFDGVRDTHDSPPPYTHTHTPSKVSWLRRSPSSLVAFLQRNGVGFWDPFVSLSMSLCPYPINLPNRIPICKTCGMHTMPLTTP